MNDQSPASLSGIWTKDTVAFLVCDRFWPCAVRQACDWQPCSSHVSTGSWSPSKEAEGREDVATWGLLPPLWPDHNYICFAHWLVWVSVLVFSYCLTNYHNFSNLKQHPFVNLMRLQVRSLDGLGCLLKVSQDWNQGIGGTGLFSGGPGKEFTSKLIQLIGNLEFLAVVGLQGPLLLLPFGRDCS